PPVHPTLERVTSEHFHRGGGERVGEPPVLLVRQRGVVLQHRVEEEVGEQASLHGGAPATRGRRGHPRGGQPEAFLQGFGRGVEQLRQQIGGGVVEREAGLGGGAQLPVRAILRLGAFLEEK